ncbi:AroM family protein [Photobacterium minamisatsumaniensis]|uniref:AroM family protein n=1 Tax=Photobacterium minamisatsumaniensis TaxID=2910233 RepID=UPI003D144257
MDSSSLLGIVTIGQLPRSDLHEDLQSLLGSQQRWVEEGALDTLSLAEIEQKYPIAGKQDILVSRMINGQQVCISESDLEPLLFRALSRIQEHEPDAILILCTGDLPSFSFDDCILLSPNNITRHFFSGLGTSSFIVMSPEEAQVENARRRWESAGFSVKSIFGSPYKDEEQLYKAALKAKDISGEFIFLDCMGYSLEHRNKIEAWSGKRVITPREIIFNTVKTLFGI